MRVCFCLLLLLIALSGMEAQKNVSFGMELFPNINTTLVDDELWSDLEESKASYGGQMFMETTLGARLTARGGIGVTVKHYQINQSEFQWPSQVGPDFTFDPTINPGEELDQLNYTHHVTFLQMPFQLHYTIATGSNYYLSCGISPMWYLANGYIVKRTVQQETTSDSYKYPDSNYKNFHVSVNAGLGFSGKLDDKLTLLLEPRVEVMPLGIYRNARLNRSFLSGGIACAVLFN